MRKKNVFKFLKENILKPEFCIKHTLPFIENAKRYNFSLKREKFHHLCILNLKEEGKYKKKKIQKTEKLWKIKRFNGAMYIVYM